MTSMPDATGPISSGSAPLPPVEPEPPNGPVRPLQINHEEVADSDQTSAKPARIRRTFSLTDAEIQSINEVKIEEALVSESAALRRLIRDGRAFRDIQRGGGNWGSRPF